VKSNSNFEDVAKVWNNGSVIRSWLMELIENAFSKDQKLDEVRGIMNSSREGQLKQRYIYKYQLSHYIITFGEHRLLQDDPFTGKVVAELCKKFGGQAVVKK
jgi:6-phosphogluconate dehydrogenase